MSIAASPARRRSSHAATFFVLVVVVAGGVAAVTLFGTSGRLPAALEAIVSRLRPPATANDGKIGAENTPTAAPAHGELRVAVASETPLRPVNRVAPTQDVEPTLARVPNAQAAAAVVQAAPTAMPQSIPTPAPPPPAATSQSLDPFVLSATGRTAQALAPAAPMAAPVHPTAVQTAQATPPASEPVDSMAVKARAGFPTGQLPPQLDSQGSPPLLPTAATPFGLRLTDVSRDEALLRMGLLSIGALVTEVVPGGDGAQAGLQPGDRLVRVASQPVVSASHFVFVATQQRGGPVEIEVIRAGTLYRAVLGGGAAR